MFPLKKVERNLKNTERHYVGDDHIFSATRITMENSYSLILTFVSSEKRLNEIWINHECANQIFSATRINIENSYSLIITFVSPKKRLNEIWLHHPCADKIISATRIIMEKSYSLIISFVSSEKRLNEILLKSSHPNAKKYKTFSGVLFPIPP